MFVQKCCSFLCFVATVWYFEWDVWFSAVYSLLFYQSMCWTSTVLSLRWDQAAEIHCDQDHIKYDYVEVGALLALGL